MSYQVAGIDVHKRMLAVVIADVAVDGEFQFERRRRLSIMLCLAATQASVSNRIWNIALS